MGPLIEDVLSAVKTVEIEINSSTAHSMLTEYSKLMRVFFSSTATDNPIFDAKKRQVHHGGNFQALSLTTSFEKTRLALFLLGKLVFSQATELLNPAVNNGLAPSVAATDPSLNYHAKGVDIAMASYVSELGWLAGHVATNVQSAEMHNQSVKCVFFFQIVIRLHLTLYFYLLLFVPSSLALISGRATLNALEVLNMVCSFLEFVIPILNRPFSYSHLISMSCVKPWIFVRSKDNSK